MTCGYGRGPTPRNLVRNTSALAAELMNCGKKRETKKLPLALVLPSLFSRLSCFVLVPLGQPIIPEDCVRARARPKCQAALRNPPTPSSYTAGSKLTAHKVLNGISQAFNWGTRQHPSNAMDGKLMTVCDRDVTQYWKRKY